MFKPMDQSFDFAYQGEEHHRQETSDVNGERTGSYSYVSPEGKEVVVQ